MNSDSGAETRPPAELIADIHELLELFGAIVDPIAERILPAIQEDLGRIELAVVIVELKARAVIRAQVEALPGAAKSK